MTVRVGSFQGTLGIPQYTSSSGFNAQGEVIFGMLPLPEGKRLDILSAIGKVKVVT
jgi:hypothetical protein